jgi:hypothetical protein
MNVDQRHNIADVPRKRRGSPPVAASSSTFRLRGDPFDAFGDTYSATGLTLPLVRRILEHQGGHVTAESHERRLEFLVDLPTSAVAPQLVSAA